jgi:hypothetical protein
MIYYSKVASSLGDLNKKFLSLSIPLMLIQSLDDFIFIDSNILKLT